MSNSNEIMERIQKYDGVEKFLILNKNGNRLNNELREEEKRGGANNFSTNYSDIPKLVDKALSVNELSFLQINYCGYDYLIAPDDELYVFTAINKNTKPN